MRARKKIRSVRIKKTSVHVRRGTAVTELAVCLPLLSFLVFGSIELCNGIHLKQTLIEACYAGALVGSQPRATEEKIIKRVEDDLSARHVTGVNVSVGGNGIGFDELVPGDLFTVHVDAPVAGNILAPIQFITFSSIEADVVGYRQQ